MRLFYDCPVKAAYMAKHFGVEFHSGGGDFAKIEIHASLGHYKEKHYGLHENKWHVHPASLPIFDPQAGDAVEFDRWHWERQRNDDCKDYPYQAHCGIVTRFGINDEWMGISSAGCGWDNTHDGKWHMPFEIIRRNGKAFIAPESEQPTPPPPSEYNEDDI